MAKKENRKNAEDYVNFMVSTTDRPYLSIKAIRGIGFKPMNILDKPKVWSSTVKISKGYTLPTRKNSALCEMLVIHGNGEYATGEIFETGDYIRETKGEYDLIQAKSDVELFITNHGATTFYGEDGEQLWKIDPDTISMLMNREVTE